MRRFLLGSILPALFIAVWEISSRTGVLTLESLSRPSDILRAGIVGLADGSILVATGQTFETALLGLTLAAFAGIIAGAGACGRSDHRGIAANSGGRLHSARSHDVWLRRIDGSDHRCIRMRMADPDRHDFRSEGN